MAYQSRVKTFLAGETLYAADLNAEFDGILATLIPEPASTTTGDFLVKGSSSWERFGAGTSGYVLTAQGAGVKPAWAAAAAGFSDPMTTQGDIIIRSSSATTRLGYGTKGKTLTTGGSGADPSWEGMTTQGDIEYFGTTRIRLGLGSTGQFLKVNDTATAPEWSNAEIDTDDIEDNAITHGASGYSVTATTLSDTTETEIGSITVTVNGTDDDVYLWASATIIQQGLSVDKGETPVPVIFRIRRTNITGAIIDAATSSGTNAGDGDFLPTVLFGVDSPGASSSQVYKLTAKCYATPYNQSAQINYKRIMCLARSK